MEEQNQFSPTQKLLQSAENIIIALPGDPTADMVSAGVSLHLTLKAAGKKSQIGCGGVVSVGPKVLGVNEIADTIGAKNLVISFDYQEDDLEKVDYDVRSDGKFYLMIKPKSGSPIPDVSNVKYSYSGASADLVITLGINSLEELGKLYADEKSFLDEAKILSLNITPRPASFTPNLLHRSTTSFSELTALLLEKCGLKPSTDAAKNLLTSIHEETKSLSSPKMTADTFAAISFLMRHGGRLPNQLAFVPRFSQPDFFEAPTTPRVIPTEVEESPSIQDDENIPLPTEEDNISFQTLQPAPTDQSTDFVSRHGGTHSTDQSPQDLDSFPVPPDWTKPKIFRATDL